MKQQEIIPDREWEKEKRKRRFSSRNKDKRKINSDYEDKSQNEEKRLEYDEDYE